MRALPGVLRVFVTTGCRGCKRAVELAEWVREVEPRLEVQVVDISVEPDAGAKLVFAVPTYLYDGKPIFLGNPSLQELGSWLDSLDPEVYSMKPSFFTSRNKSAKHDLATPQSCQLGVDKLELLSSMDILRDLSADEIEALMDKSPMRTAIKGTVFYGPEGPEVLFLLKSGKVELYRQSPDGRKLTLATVKEGTFFGEMSLIGLHLTGTYAVAREDCVICVLSRHDVESLMLEHPTVALRLVEVVTHRLEETRGLLQEIAFNDLTGKVAGLLLQLAGEDTNIIDGYSHEDLAARVGCLRESFTAVLDRFKRSNAVATGRKRIQITGRAQLEGIVNQRTGTPSGQE